jgi:hypothetical protein
MFLNPRRIRAGGRWAWAAALGAPEARGWMRRSRGCGVRDDRHAVQIGRQGCLGAGSLSVDDDDQTLGDGRSGRDRSRTVGLDRCGAIWARQSSAAASASRREAPEDPVGAVDGPRLPRWSAGRGHRLVHLSHCFAAQNPPEPACKTTRRPVPGPEARLACSISRRKDRLAKWRDYVERGTALYVSAHCPVAACTRKCAAGPPGSLSTVTSPSPKGPRRGACRDWRARHR